MPAPPKFAIKLIQGLLDKMTSEDKDFRFMATNDLIAELQRDNLTLDDDCYTNITYQIINLLRDKNGEVQNLAVKCLGYLIGRIKDNHRLLVIESLCEMLTHDSEQIRDIASIALKTVVSEIPINKKAIDIFNKTLNPNLMVAIANSNDVNVQLESLDILTELINRAGSHLNANHIRMQQELIKQLDSERSVVRKRSMNALSYLLACCPEELFNETLLQLMNLLIEVAPKPIDGDAEMRNTFDPATTTTSKTLLQCTAAVIRVAGHRCTQTQLNRIIPVIFSYSQINDDELREYSLLAYEAYVRRCPVNVSDSLPSIIRICLINISYDPNYNYGEEGESDTPMETDSMDEDDSDSAEDYSDEDDLSWKVRRASVKCLESIILARRDLVDELFSAVGPTLVSRFKEREESVKAEIIQAFTALLKQTRISIQEDQGIETTAAVSRLKEMIPKIVAKSSHLLREKSIKIRQALFQTYTEIMNIIPDAFSSHIDALVPGVFFSLTDKNSTSNMKIDTLLLVQELIKTHQPTVFYSQMQNILDHVVNAVGDTFYRIAAEALSLLCLLVCVIRPPNCEPMQGYESVLSIIYEKTLERTSRNDLDLEVKERAISCLGQIVAQFGDRMEDQLAVALDMLHERMKSETTRLTCVKALIKIANSPIDIRLNSLFPGAFSTIAPFLKKNSRQLKISALTLIENVIRRSADLLDDGPSQSTIMADVPNLICESDLYISQLALNMLTTMIKAHRVNIPIIPLQVLPETLKLIRSPLLQGAALQTTLHFFSTIVQSSLNDLDHSTLLRNLVGPIYSGMPVHRQAFYSTAKVIAAISTHDQDLSLSTVNQLVEDCKKNHENDNIYILILLSIGEIGKRTNLCQVPQLVDVILQAFNSSSEEVKSAGSYALGCVAVGNSNEYLPVILQEIEAKNRRQYLMLHSLREVISSGHIDHIETIWQALMKHCECPEEGTRNVVSECLGQLTLLNPTIYLQRLLENLKKDYVGKPLARATIVSAVKFTISDQPQEIDDLLRQCIGEFLLSLQDDDINVRRVALITLNSVAHNKPSLIINLMPQILPLLFKETLIKPELIREVEMGPFKHQVDDGLDSRKAAFECMYTLLDTCPIQINSFEFLKHFESGLRDHYDIKMLAYLMLDRLIYVYPLAILQRMEHLIYPIEDVCRTKPKENTVKQEHEKQDELKRSALRAFDALKSIPTADRHPAVVGFDGTIQNDKNLSELYSSVHRDIVVSNEGVISYR